MVRSTGVVDEVDVVVDMMKREERENDSEESARERLCDESGSRAGEVERVA